MTIAEIAYEYLQENDFDVISWGDVYNLDAIAERAKHTNLLSLHPLERHRRILNALERSRLFKKFYIRLDIFQNNQSRLVRAFKFNEVEND